MSGPTIATVRETKESPYAVAIEVSAFRLTGDEPQSSGGGGLGPSPYEFLTVALAECTVMTVRWYALQQKWPLDCAEAVVTHHKNGRQDVFEKRLILHGYELTDGQREKLMDVSAKCPVQRTLEAAPIITTVPS